MVNKKVKTKRNIWGIAKYFVLYYLLAFIAFTLIYNQIHFLAYNLQLLIGLFIVGAFPVIMYTWKTRVPKTLAITLMSLTILSLLYYLIQSIPMTWIVMGFISAIIMLSPLAIPTNTELERMLTTTVYALLIALFLSTPAAITIEIFAGIVFLDYMTSTNRKVKLNDNITI